MGHYAKKQDAASVDPQGIIIPAPQPNVSYGSGNALLAKYKSIDAQMTTALQAKQSEIIHGKSVAPSADVVGTPSIKPEIALANIIGKTIAAAEIEDEAVKLSFTDGSRARFWVPQPKKSDLENHVLELLDQHFKSKPELYPEPVPEPEPPQAEYVRGMGTVFFEGEDWYKCRAENCSNLYRREIDRDQHEGVHEMQDAHVINPQSGYATGLAKVAASTGITTSFDDPNDALDALFAPDAVGSALQSKGRNLGPSAVQAAADALKADWDSVDMLDQLFDDEPKSERVSRHYYAVSRETCMI